MTDAYTNEPYDTENFWSDIEKLSQVHTFKFAGGEPLMNPNFYKLLEKLIIL